MIKTPITTFKTRIAPTPSGFLHIGNVFSFVLTWLWAKLNNGELLLRIDDMDGERSRDEYVRDIFETLQFLGIDYNEGPRNINDYKQNFTQIKKLKNYSAAIEKLAEQENLYACICSRKGAQVNSRLVDPLNCKNKNLPFDTANSALRINLQTNVIVTLQDILNGEMNVNLFTDIPDFIIRQKNNLPSYQICSLVDDLQFCITHIVRGEDLLPSTAAQLYLAKLLGNEKFQQVQFLHHPIIKTKDGEKLSKSAGDTSIKYMRSNGFTAKQVLKQIIEMFGIKDCHAENIQALLQFIIANDDEEIGIFAKLKQVDS